jgi:threonyl-tRNA synthetase
VSDRFNAYGREVLATLRRAGLRAELDDSSDKVGAKIRRATLRRIPYMLVVGAKEAEAGTVSVRDKALGDLGAESVEAFVERAEEEVREKRLRPEPAAD